MRKLLLGLLICLASTTAFAQCSNLFFSEYLEGASNNKAIEIYNPTSAPINLTNYVIYRYNNGSPTPTDSLHPQDILAAGDVWVAGNPTAIAAITGVSDTLHTITFFNGDDALTLVQKSPRVVLDVIGEVGVDPGVNWPVGTGATSEFTLVRQIGIQGGSTSWTTAATQYDVYPQNTTTFLGAHSMNPCITPAAPVIQFASGATTTPETAGSITVNVNIAYVSAITPTSVDVVVQTGGTATATDYTYSTTTLTWAANDSTPKTLTIPILDDAIAEPTESFVLEFQNSTNNSTIGGNATHTVTITDNDFSTYPIGTINTTDSVGVADSLGLKCWTHGVVYGVNMRPAGLQFTIIDATGGIGVFRGAGSLGYTVNETDSVKILGTVGQFNGLTQITVDSIVLISSPSNLKQATQVTALGENTESDLTVFKNAWLVNPTQWTGTGSGFNVDVTDGTNTIQVRIDADVDLYTMPAPVGKFHVCGLGGQFDNSNPYTSGYQLLPRYAADIKLLPVAMLGADTAYCDGGSLTIGTANNGDTYLWNTGDQTQTITVSAAGTYSVIVTDTTLNEMAYDTIVVTVQPLPVASFTTSGTTPTFTFTDNSTNGTSVSWNFGDGNTSTASNPSNTYATPGTYVVTLIVSNACGSDTTTDSVTVLVGVRDGLQAAVHITPNPSNGQFVVDVQGIGEQAATLTIADAMGRIVWTQAGGLRQSVAAPLAPGIYFVRMLTAEGTATSRILIQ